MHKISKNSFIVIFFLLLVYSSFSQDSTRTTKVEQYCEVLATAKMMSNKVSIEVTYGDEVNTFWKKQDKRIMDEDGKIKKFNNVIDALNFMGKDGWTLVSAFPIERVFHYYFKKSFTAAEVEEIKK